MFVHFVLVTHLPPLKRRALVSPLFNEAGPLRLRARTALVIRSASLSQCVPDNFLFSHARLL
eukprot:m.60134 g.60134  ORF g.60134 m.60134 type:complete len:62 (+) comp17409_c0_seq1:178-363(+)